MRRVTISAPEAQLALVPDVERDLRASGLIEQIETEPGEALAVRVELAPLETAERRE